MKTTNAINTLKKQGFEVTQDGRKFWATLPANQNILAFYDQEGTIVCLNITDRVALSEDDHMMNQNCYTSYPSTMKAAIRWAKEGGITADADKLAGELDLRSTAPALIEGSSLSVRLNTIAADLRDGRIGFKAADKLADYEVELHDAEGN